MEYSDQFELDFMKRTLKIVNDYEGELDATLLINCLLGLLIVPREKSFIKIPQDPIEMIDKWGISLNSIKDLGVYQDGTPRRRNLRELVRGLRNSIAHFSISPIKGNKVVKGFKFRDEGSFHAEVSLEEMKLFVQRLAEHLEKQY